MVIVAPSSRPVVERFKDYLPAILASPRLVELLVYTPEEFDAMRAEERPFLIHAMEREVVLRLRSQRFASAQAAEKALKSLCYGQGERLVPGHSIVELVVRLARVSSDAVKLREQAGLLDQYYVATRYPNGLPGGVPFEAFGERQAREAIEAGAGVRGDGEARGQRTGVRGVTGSVTAPWSTPLRQTEVRSTRIG